MKKLTKQLQLQEDIDINKLMTGDATSDEFLMTMLKFKANADQYRDNIRKTENDIQLIELEFINNLRKEAENGGYYTLAGVKTKLTETALGKMPYKFDSKWQKYQKMLIDDRFNLDVLNSLINVMEKKYNLNFKKDCK